MTETLKQTKRIYWNMKFQPEWIIGYWSELLGISRAEVWEWLFPDIEVLEWELGEEA